MQESTNTQGISAGLRAYADVASLGRPIPGSRRLKDFNVANDGQVLDMQTGRSYTLNPTGQVALLLMQDGLGRDVVIDELARRGDQQRAVVEAGIDAFLRQVCHYAS